MIDSLPGLIAQMPMPELSNGIPAAGKSPAEVFAFLLLDIAIILVAARIVGTVFVKIGQPRVVGEIIAGILIGPTILGGNLARADVLATPDVSEFIAGTGAVNDVFPLGSFAFLSLIGNLTLVFFMFLVGLEVQQRFLKGRGMQILVVALAVVLVPVGFGFLLAGILDGTEWKAPGVSTTTHALVIGAALAVTAFPVMARILQEKRMLATDMGAIGVGAAAVVTPLMFLVLAGASVSAKGEAAGVPSAVGIKLLFALALTAFLFIAVRPFLRSVVLRGFDPKKPLSGDVLAILLFGAIASGFAADRIGINALNGGFLFGACVPQIEGIGKAVIDRMSDFVVIFLIPIFLAVAGLQTDFTVLTADLIPGIVLFVAAMIVGKWFVGAGAGMALGLKFKEANTIGVLMNCRGLMILVVAIVAGSFGAMTPEMRVVFALGAIITTVMTGPLVDVFVPKADTEAEREKSIAGSIAAMPALTGGPRVLIAPGTAFNLADVTAAAKRYTVEGGEKPQFLLASLRGLDPTGDYVGAALESEPEEQDRSVTQMLGWLRPGAEQLKEAGVDAEAVSFESPEPQEDLAKLATDWGATDAIATTPEDVRALEAAGIKVQRAGGEG